MSMKGQAAMEYLMTYGWALIAIVLVIGALFFIFQNFKGPDICQFQGAGFWCDKAPQAYLDDSNTVKLNIEFTNQLGRTVDVHKVLCTTVSPSEVTDEYASTEDKLLASGGSLKVTDLSCYNDKGKEIVGAANQQLKANLIVWYNYEDDIDTSKPRVAVASISVTPYKAQ